jgi:hypothetical protein
MVLRFERDDHVGSVFYHNVGGVRIAIWANAKGTPNLDSDLYNATDADFVEEGSLRIYVDTGPGHANAGTGTTYSGGAGGSITSAHLNFNNDVNCAVVVIHFGSPTGNLNPEGSANNGVVNQIRVNGVPCYEFTADANTNSSSVSSEDYSMFGSVIKNNRNWYDPSNSAHNNSANPPYPFVGSLAEVITVLPDQTSALYDKPTAGPNGSGLKINPTLGTDGVGTAERNDMSGSATTASTATEIEHLEGYLAHKWGISHLLPNGYGASAKDDNDYYLNHPFGDASGGTYYPGKGSGGTSTLDANPAETALASTNPITAKYDGNTGAFMWAYAGSGMGYGIAVDKSDDVYIVGTDAAGEATPTSTTAVVARKLIDKGSTVSAATSDGAWALTSAEANTFGAGDIVAPNGDQYQNQVTKNPYTRLAVDSHGDLYWPRALAASSKNAQIVKIIGSTYTPSTGGDAVSAKTVAWYISAHSSQDCYSVALPTTQPGYGYTDVIGPEFMYLGTSSTTAEPANVRQVRLVTAAINNSGDAYSPRTTTYLSVSGGAIRTFTKDANTNQIYHATAGNADTQLEADSDYVQAVPMFGKVYFTDGLNYRVYSPPITGQTGTKQYGEVKDWKAKVGEMPVRPNLMVGWHGRIVMARTADDAYDWQMSKMGDPENWDYYPTQITPTQAVTGSSSRFGKSPDIINALVPYSDDLLIFGGDATIMRMTGDPMSGGQLDLVSDATGMAFGKSWCRGPGGTIFFFGSRGGVYSLNPTGGMTKISAAIDRRLIDVDTAASRVELVWDHVENGLHVFLLYYGSTVAPQTHYFWDAKNNAWFEDTFNSNVQAVQPTAIGTLDGDTGQDRVIVTGGSTGLLYFWDRDALSDNGTSIESEVLLGPLSPNNVPGSVRWSRLEALLAEDQGGARYEFMSNDVPDVVGDVVGAGELSGGANHIQPVRARGRSVWVRLRNRQASERWALEHLSVMASPSGRRRIK